MTRENMTNLVRELKKARRRLKKENRSRLCAECSALLGAVPPFKVTFREGAPLIAALASAEERITTETVLEFLSPIAAELTNSDFISLLWQLKASSLLAAVENSALEGRFYIVSDVDCDFLNDKLNPLHRRFLDDSVYRCSSRETQSLCRFKTSRAAEVTDIPEARLAHEYLRTAQDSDSDVCTVVWADYRRIFPHASVAAYIIWQMALAVGITGIATVLSGWFVGLSVFTPALAIAKTLVDRILMRSTKPEPLPSVSADEAEKYDAVCVLSALCDGEESLRAAIDKLNTAKIKNNTKNIFCCLLCDLPAANERETDADDEMIAAARRLSELPDSPIILIRHRDYSRTQEKYQGKERKRGAIEDLMRFIAGEEVSFRFVSGDTARLRHVPFVCALDYDTVPLMDSVNSLISAALHPVNSDYGIFVPRLTVSLDSASRTALSRLFIGSGGCSGVSVYDSADMELYYSCFGEGTFTGKGLIRTDKFYRECVGRFPDEKILSHDILEGGLLRVAYCGSVEFSDSFPPTVKGYFKRLHRWLRGDFQNVRFLLMPEFSPLTRFKLSDNIRRGIFPVYALLTLFFCAPYGDYFCAAVALLSVTLPFLLGLIPAALRGLGFSNTREFYAPISSLSRQLVSQLFGEIIFLPKNAALCLDALLRTAWRLITGKKLLEWQTASQFDRIGAIGYAHMIIPELTALALFWLSVSFGNILTGIASLLMICALPAAVMLDRALKFPKTAIKDSDRADLLEQAQLLWNFYDDYVTESDNFLPPDNVQYSPVYRVARRTSPTNIGMYLISCVSAAELGIIDVTEAVTCISRTLSTVEGLEKYAGNLYNWYNTEDLSVLGEFVSAVDSGNFLCCLVAVKQWLYACGCEPSIIERIEKLLGEADLKTFYNPVRKLFSVGINGKTGEKMPNCYDMLMSEARMLSYYAIATGQADKQHWRALSRIMSKNGHYAGPVAWTGTMFEFFMPELLLESKVGSLSYEALGYAVYCQRERGKRRRLPFGISESGYFSFDRELNYQYKAHGVQKLALCSGMDKEYVISPYSTFLALSHSFSACMENLARICQPQFMHSRYGCYEAIDLTERRTGGADAVVKSHMAHHIGMSMGGIANALCGGILRKLFASDPTMQRADELLEERVMSGEVIVDIEKLREKRTAGSPREEFTSFELLRPRMGVVANHKLAVFASDTGLYYGRFGGKSTMIPSPDYLRRPRGMFFGIAADGREIPFFMTVYDNGDPLERSVVFGENSAEWYVNGAGLRCGMRLSLFGENAAEVREFSLENLTNAPKTAAITAYFEPALAHERDISAHPAFMDLFIKTEYDEKENVVLIHRKERHGDRETWACIGFSHAATFNYCFDREAVSRPNEPMSFLEHSGSENDPVSVPSPCVFADLPVQINAGGRFDAELFVCYGESRNEVLGICRDIRAKKEQIPSVSPLPPATMQGRIARQLLPALLCRNVYSEEILLAESSLGRRALWRFGISGDKPILLYRHEGEQMNLEAALLTLGGLCGCGIEADLVIICINNIQKEKAEALIPDYRKNAFVLTDAALSEEEKALLKRSAAFIFGKTEQKKAPAALMEILPCEMLKTGEKTGFSDEKFVIDEKGHPWCNIIASREFGTLVSQNSLGFSYALNSRENKLTPWYNDILRDNNGEMLLVRGNGCYYDIVAGARTVFSPNKADYYGLVGKTEFHTAVRVYEKGMGKELSVSVKNPSAHEKRCALTYYIEPILGADRESGNFGAAFAYTRDENAVYVRNTANEDFRGEMAVYCDRETLCTTSREQFFAGEAEGELRPFPFGCVALTVKIKLPPRSTEKVKFILAFSKGDSRRQLEAFANVGTEWKKRYSPKIESASPELNRLYNTWLPWQAVGCRMWARTGFYQNGGAYGFRDQLQDSLAALQFMPEETKRQILRCCASQFYEGDVLHWWHRTDRGRKGVRTRYSDDLLWLPYVTAEYVKKTGDRDILGLNVQYIKGGELGELHEKYMEVENGDVREDVYSHCKKALEKGYKKGDHSLLKIGCGDWNDGYNNVGIKGRGESVWLSMFYVLTAKEFAPLARAAGDETFADELEKRGAELTRAIENNAFENGYYLRAFYDDGSKMGAQDSRYCKIDLLPQAFSVLANLPDKEKSESALKNAYTQLVDEQNRIIKLFTPAFADVTEAEDPGYVKSYPAGVRENGGQYTHAAVWLALAFLRSGDKVTAKRLAEFLSPAARSAAFKNEPYYMTADVYTNPDAYGRGGWSLYTGAAAWYYILLGELFGNK